MLDCPQVNASLFPLQVPGPQSSMRGRAGGRKALRHIEQFEGAEQVWGVTAIPGYLKVNSTSQGGTHSPAWKPAGLPMPTSSKLLS